MRRRWISIAAAAMLAVVVTALARPPGHAAGLSVDPDRVTVQVISNPLP